MIGCGRKLKGGTFTTIASSLPQRYIDLDENISINDVRKLPRGQAVMVEVNPIVT